MFQITFTDAGSAEMAELPKELQLEILSEFQVLPEDLTPETAGEKFGVLEREGRVYYRYRTRDYRIYFRTGAGGIVICRVLNKNSLGDLLFRTNLTSAGEDETLQKDPGFWAMIEPEEDKGKKRG